MYSYIWDTDTGGYLLEAKTTSVKKEVRPVFKEELKLLGFDKQFGWKIPDTELPLMWAEGRRYCYLGECIAEAIGGGLYELPQLKSDVRNLKIKPVDIAGMVRRNSVLMAGLVQKTLAFIYDTYKEHQKKVNITYVAFSGGKDSIVMLDLVQRALPHDGFEVVFADTTMELQATYRAIEAAKNHWSDLSWHIAKSTFDAKESWSKIGYPARNLRWCCSVHKTAPSILKLQEIISRNPLKYNGRCHQVMVFDGIRKEESEARSTYSMVTEGGKHATQTNCSPIFQWNTSEIYLYMFEYNLFINAMYRYGVSRVGCKLCPMASNWYECILNHLCPEELTPLLDIIQTSIKKHFKSENDKKKYFQSGGWKSRIGGRELNIGENKVIEIKSSDGVKFVISSGNYNWDKWMPTLGEFVKLGENKYLLNYGDVEVLIDATTKDNFTVLTVKSQETGQRFIKFIHLFKNALNKASYCVNCGICAVECVFGALRISDSDIHIGSNCKSCGECLNSRVGCIVARSVYISGGGNNVSENNMSRYQNFGFRKEWLELFFELGDDFWTNERMGKYMVVGFRIWLKESLLAENNKISYLGNQLKNCEEPSLVWAVIFTNLAYNSPIINWYVSKIDFGEQRTINDMVIMLGDKYTLTTRKNALSSLKETLRYSPIGSVLGQGECELKGKTVLSIKRRGWANPNPLAVLYALYKFAEKSDHYYSFTLSDLFDETTERIGISPVKLYNLSRETCRELLVELARNYGDFIKINFNKDIMEDIYLSSDKTSLDVVPLF